MSKSKILIIDDEVGFTTVLKMNLEKTGKYDILIENDPNNALTCALRFRPNLLLIDIIMPNKEGPDVANDIKSNPILKDIPILFLTATVTSEEVEMQNGEIGGHSFVAKPSTLGELIEAIDRKILHSSY
jgi:CheY-like chemotaxis protein